MIRAMPSSGDETPFSLSDCQRATWRASCKLRAIGEVFERQVDSADDGYPELIGLGMVLGDLSVDLEGVAQALDLLTCSEGPKES